MNLPIGTNLKKAEFFSETAMAFKLLEMYYRLTPELQQELLEAITKMEAQSIK